MKDTAEKVYKATVKMGRRIPVVNQKPRPRSKDQFVAVWTDNYDGSERQCLLFTQTQIDIAVRRANNNPEDCPAIGKLMTLFRKGL